MPNSKQPIFVAGAGGYIGGRLVPRLLEAGYRVRALARSPGEIAQPTLGKTPGTGNRPR